MMWIPPALVYDALTKDTTNKRYLAAIWEKIREVGEAIVGIRSSLDDLKTEVELRKENAELKDKIQQLESESSENES